MKKIIAGPFFGEFGWELMRWQGIFRNLANKGYKIIMVSRPGHDALYEDYVEDFIGIEAPPNGETDGWRINGQVPKLGRGLLDKYPEYKYMDPSTCMKLGVDPLGAGQTFIKYGTKNTTTINSTRYIVIHPRSTNKCNTNNRNWCNENWLKLVDKMYNLGYLIATIGSRSGAISLKYTTDLRGIPLKELTSIIHNAELVVGPSSGPMHLASLCGTPHLVWTDNKIWGSCNGTNRERYEKNWNPLGTKSILLDEDNWQPSVDKVYNAIKENLNETQVRKEI